MDQQMKVADSSLPSRSSLMRYGSEDLHCYLTGEEGLILDGELHPESSSEFSDTATLEQRRAYKLEIQV